MAELVLTDSIKDKTLSINAQGLTLLLPLKKGLELAQDTLLTIKPYTKDLKDNGSNVEESNDTLLKDVNISSDQGAFMTGQSVSWLLVDWGVERPLNNIQVTLNTPNPKCKIRIKVFSYGHWMPLMPIDVFASDKQQGFASVLTSKVMLELGTVGDYSLWTSCTADVKGVVVQADTAPSDISLSLAGQRFYNKTGVLPVSGVVVDNFAQAINAYRQKNPDEFNIPLQLSANTAGQINIDFTPKIQQLLQTLPDQVLRWSNELNKAKVQTQVLLTANAKLQSMTMDIKFDADAERVQVQGEAVIETTQHAQFINERSQIAHCCHNEAEESILTGVAIQLRQRSDTLDVSLAIHPDQHNYPKEQPYVTLNLDNAEWQNDWLFLNFKTPIKLTDAIWWLVLSVKGEAFWQFRQPMIKKKYIALYRIDSGSWLNCMEGLELQTKIRLLDNEQKKLTNCVLTRGTVSQEEEIVGNKLTVNSATLDALNTVSDTILNLQFIAEATGTLTFDNLRIIYT